MTFDELPDWTFTVEEVSMSVYKVIGTDPLGRSIERTGYDLNELIEEAKSAAGTVANAQ